MIAAPVSTAPHVRGALVGFAAFSMGILGFPGLDQKSMDWLQDPEDRKDAPMNELLAADFQHHVRRPITSALSHLERPLRLAQSWNLYGVGPNRMVRFEVLVDDVSWFRAADPAHTYRKAFLRYRRIRPVVVNTCLDQSRHSERLVELLVEDVRADAPDARKVVVRCTSARWPGTGEAKEMVRWTAEAPTWEPSR